jgi:hypothetical protein
MARGFAGLDPGVQAQRLILSVPTPACAGWLRLTISDVDARAGSAREPVDEPAIHRAKARRARVHSRPDGVNLRPNIVSVLMGPDMDMGNSPQNMRQRSPVACCHAPSWY